LKNDIKKADLLLVMGTSLQVAPVSHIPHMVQCNRVLFNRDLVMQVKKNDLFIRGDCDENISALCDILGWTKDLKDLNDQSVIGVCENKTTSEDAATIDDSKKEVGDDETQQGTDEETVNVPEPSDEPQNDVTNEEVAVAADHGSDDEFTPSTILVLLGSLMFEPSGESDVLSIKIQTPEEMQGALKKAKSDVKPYSIETLHVILMASAASSVWDDAILSTLLETLKPEGESQVNIHVMASPHIPVESGDVDPLRSALILSGLMLEQEAMMGDDGGWVLTARTM
jgi:hypothetical protein